MLAELRRTPRHRRACAPRCIRRERLANQRLDVPGDFSSAAFFIVAGLLGAAAEGLLMQNVGLNPTRTGLLDILRSMGGDIEIVNPRSSGAEPVADLRVRASALRGSARARWSSCRSRSMNFRCCSSRPPARPARPWSRGAEELRVKESDRIAAMSAGSRGLGRGARGLARRHAHRGPRRRPGVRRRRGRQPRRSPGGHVL